MLRNTTYLATLLFLFSILFLAVPAAYAQSTSAASVSSVYVTLVAMSLPIASILLRRRRRK